MLKAAHLQTISSIRDEVTAKSIESKSIFKAGHGSEHSWASATVLCLCACVCFLEVHG